MKCPICSAIFFILALVAPTNAAEPTSAAALTQPAAAETVTTHSSSLWVKSTSEVDGAYRIEQREDGRYLVLTDDFKTKSAPDLKIVLSKIDHEDVTARTALSNGAVVISLLDSNRGGQEFRIPDSVDLNEFETVLIHCEQYTKLWAAAPLSEGEVLAHGDDWTKKSNKITGNWEIASTESGLVLRIADDFKTKNAPDLKLVLSPNTIRGARANNALAGGTVIAPLQSNRGAQEYAISGVTSLEGFNSLLIHCEQYTKLWGGVSLN